jgi:periplasmic divalent cation tolerance protein
MSHAALPDPNAEWWTTSDIARFLGVQIGTVSSYRIRGQMPEPDETSGRTHRWRPARIVAWRESRPRPGIGGRPEGEPDQERCAHYFLSVSTATETRQDAENLARLAVESRLAAGAQITGPVVSAFWHLGEFGTGEEWRLVLQTHADRYADLEELLIANHPWQKPEIAALPIVAGSAEYFDWLSKSIDLKEADAATP